MFMSERVRGTSMLGLGVSCADTTAGKTVASIEQMNSVFNGTLLLVVLAVLNR
jgi:hypothetical protein